MIMKTFNLASFAFLFAVTAVAQDLGAITQQIAQLPQCGVSSSLLVETLELIVAIVHHQSPWESRRVWLWGNRYQLSLHQPELWLWYPRLQ
jgi:hypothetical protein